MGNIVAIIFSRFGPYHVARLEAAGRKAQQTGDRVVGIEVAGKCGYGWEQTRGAQAYERVSLFPDRNRNCISCHEIIKSVTVALQNLRPDTIAIPGWSFAEAVAAVRWCRKNKCLSICMSESKRDDDARVWWKEWMKTRRIRPVQAALVGGTPHADYIVDLRIPRDRVVTGYDVVDNDWFARGAAAARAAAAERRRAYGLPERFFYANARLIPRKNIVRLIDAYAVYARQSDRPWALVITGDGPCRHALLRRCIDLKLPMGLSPRMVSMNPSDTCAIDPASIQGGGRGKVLRRPAVYWPGFVQYDDLPVYYGLASAFVMPSVQEQWGLVVNEAMAAGLPVLVSRTAGCRYDLVDDGGNGWLVDPLSVDDLAGALTRMAACDDADRAVMGQRSSERISAWGPDRFADSLWHALHLAAKPRPPMTMAERMAFRLAVLSRRWT